GIRRGGAAHGPREPLGRAWTGARRRGRAGPSAGPVPAALPPRRPALRLRAVGHAVRAGDAERVPPRRRRDPLGRDAGGRGALRRGRRPPRQLRAMKTIRTETQAGVCSIALARPAEYNPVHPALRDELA